MEFSLFILFGNIGAHNSARSDQQIQFYMAQISIQINTFNASHSFREELQYLV